MKPREDQSREDDFFTYALRVTLKATGAAAANAKTITSSSSVANEPVIPMPLLAIELKTTEITSQNCEHVLYGRLSADPNDLVPRPTNSILRYLVGCVSRIQEYRRLKAIQDVAHPLFKAVETCRTICVNYLTSLLQFPDIFPSSTGMWRSHAGNPLNDQAEELFDLLKTSMTSSNAFYVMELVGANAASQDPHMPTEIISPLIQVVSKAASQSATESTTESTLAALSSDRVWGQAICEVCCDPNKDLNPGRFEADVFVNDLPRGVYRFRRGARFEREAVLGPILIAASLTKEMSENYMTPNRMLSREQAALLLKGFKQQLAFRRNFVAETFLNMCKAGKDSRGNVLRWMETCLRLNSEREKGFSDRAAHSSDEYMDTITFSLLHLFPKAEHEADKHIASLLAEAYPLILNLYPNDFTKLNNASATSTSPPITTTTLKQSFDPNNAKFVSRCFVLALEAIHLGPVHVFLQMKHFSRTFNIYADRAGEGWETNWNVMQIFQSLQKSYASVTEPEYFSRIVSLHALATRWIVNLLIFGGERSGGGGITPLPLPSWSDHPGLKLPLTANAPHAAEVARLPESVVHDMVTVLNAAHQMRFIDHMLGRAADSSADPFVLVPLEAMRHILDFSLLLMGSPGVCASPHLRARETALANTFSS